MFKSGKKILKPLLCITLSAGMLVTQPAFAFGEEGETAAESPTPTPDPHTEAYYAAPESNSIPGWPQGPQVEARSATLFPPHSKKLYSFLKSPAECWVSVIQETTNFQ